MEKITDLSQLNLQQTYSYADYLTWQLSHAVELIKGKIMAMSLAPSVNHQRISRNLTLVLGRELPNNGCELFNAPFDVRLYDSRKSKKANKDVYTVVQPDLCIICDPHKLDEQGCVGAPEFVVEVLSKGNSKREMNIKYTLYEESGVLEYWVVDPEHEHLLQFVANDQGRFEFKRAVAHDEAAIPHLFPHISVDMTEIFAKPNQPI